MEGAAVWLRASHAGPAHAPTPLVLAGVVADRPAGEELPVDPGLGVRAAVAVSAVFHLLLFLVAPLVEGYIGRDELPAPPEVEYVSLDQPPPEEAKAKPEKPPEVEPTPEPTPPPEEAKATEEEPAEEAKATEEQPAEEQGGDEGTAPEEAAKAPGATEEGNAPEPPPGATASEPPPELPPAAPVAPPAAAVAAVLPPAGGNAAEGEEKPQGSEMEPPMSPPGFEAPVDAGPDETTALGAELGPEVVVPPWNAEVKVLPGYEPGANLTTDETKYDWGPYMRALWRVVDPRISPLLPRVMPPHAINPILDMDVAQDGGIRSLRLHRSSGVVEIDRAVMTGLRSGRLPQLPEGYPKPVKELRLEFELPRKSP